MSNPELIESSSFKTFAELARHMGRAGLLDTNRPVVCVQGLGFVGMAMALAVANSKDVDGSPYFNVIGIDIPTPIGLSRVNALNAGRLPIESTDPKLTTAVQYAHEAGNLLAVTDPSVYALASVTIMDVPLDLTTNQGQLSPAWEGFHAAVKTLGQWMPQDSLIIVETTVPPGTCQRIVRPLIEECLSARGLPNDAIRIAHAYERIMPGNAYYDSIINYWRVYSGCTLAAADACERFLSKIIDVRKYPLTRLASTTASEIGKVLENSYRAVTIAFMEEWGRFAEAIDVDLFEVIDAIRIRPTHSNMRQPGFGVGGYCLTKDPLFAWVASKEIFGRDDLDFPFCRQAVDINQRMPLASLDKVESLLGGSLKDKTLLLMGVSYRPDVEDTRSSPSEIFIKQAKKRGAHVVCHDPIVKYWPEMDITISGVIPSLDDIDAVVFAVSHPHYQTLDMKSWLTDVKTCIFDANKVLTSRQREDLSQMGAKVGSIGRGEVR
jgi:UDP-N-acetyl-D-glucosamine dehydrogenase